MNIGTKNKLYEMLGIRVAQHFIVLVCGIIVITLFPYAAHSAPSKHTSIRHKNKKTLNAAHKTTPAKKSVLSQKNSAIQKSSRAQKSPAYNKVAANNNLLQDELVKYLGTQYQMGGNGPDGLDCSGFSRLIYKKVYGVELPHNAASQSKCPSSVLKKVSLDNLKTGDLIFFSPTTRKQRINHVGIYLADGQFIHASQNRQQVVISNLFDTHWRSRIVSTKGRSAGGAWWAEEDTTETSAGVAYKPDKKTTVSLRYKATIRPTARGTQKQYARTISANQKQDIELAYARDIYGKTWNVNMAAFREQFFTDDGGPAYSHYSETSASTISLKDYIQGIRMASDIKPVDWLSITPSITYLSYSNQMETVDLPWRTFGVDVNLMAPSNRWSLSTGVQYSNLNKSNQLLSYNNNVGMSVTYRQQLSDRLNLTLIGQHFEQSGSELDDIHIDPQTDEQLAFMLNFIY